MKKKDLNEMSNEELWLLFPIILSPHNPEWPRRYETEKELLIKTIGAENIVRINHIGSTAVPGLTAKPTIDILLEIQQETDPVRLIPTIESAGYIYCHKPDNPPPPHDVYERIYARRV
ncbi:GrpB family protein [Parabacteroides gordonii]|uniref:GrpB family protein n=1 Tax=Parabacteroides gordonii TaxID=574930 RepID=UPI0026EE8878|nr:GrpB family protein [Parabacteroides gordonii]